MAGVIKRKGHNERKESGNDQSKMPDVKDNQIMSNVRIGRDAIIYMNSTNGKLHSVSK